ncbi:MAG TPA: WYL domain-containing protein [Fibrobacteraceae bacterium]|nr:WYL domain-containing protein [Fibrobacteraceae bacterium]HPW94111.1 WYL domain-containing protein [Fibrobacteraceae bacterium]HQB64420.1 WYL domain-containing protein [Fibrobacteraceae bacterium]
MASTYEKLNRLKLRLMTSPATVEELANYMDCNTRTIFRFLKDLSKENSSLRKIKNPGQPRRFFIEQTKNNVNAPLIRSLRKLHKELTDHAEIRYTKVINKAIDALEGKTPETDCAPEAISLDPDFIIDHGPFSEYDISEARIERYLTAIKKGQCMKVHYMQGSSGEIQKLEIRPLKLILRMGTLYLAYSTEKTKNVKPKLLVVKRIRQESLMQEFFKLQEIDVQNFYKYCYGKWVGDSEKTVILKLLLLVKEPWLESQFRESHFNPPAKIKKQKNHSTIELNLYDSPDLRKWIIGLLPDIEIIEPVLFKEEIKKMIQTSLKALKS